MTRKLCGTLLALLVSVIIHAQQSNTNYNSLLWRISGKGIKKPSYLYGTMHLMDKRLFNFSDSLYHFLETTEGFAAELDMASLMPQLINEIKGEKSNGTLIKDVVSNQRLSNYKVRLEKYFGRKLEKITVDELRQAKSKFVNKLLRRGEMATIMDLYLFDIARQQGKWVGGIEDFEDQFGKVSEEDEIMSIVRELLADEKESSQEVERMIKIYLSQQLNAIDLANEIWKGAEQNTLIKRNIKMARRIDSIMNLRTCVFAVGAAHIPGDSGLVMLLRSKGFSVDPVYSARNIEPANYTFKAVEIPWQKSAISGDWYAIEMPGKSEKLELSKEVDGLEVQFYFDLTKMNAFFTFSLPSTSIAKKNKDSLYDEMAKNFSKQGEVSKGKEIMVNGVKGKEFIVKGEENDMRIQFFLPGSSVVFNIISTFKYDSLFGQSANRFLNSFRLIKDPPALTSNSWQTYSFPKHGFSIKFPEPFTKFRRDERYDTIWRTNVYMATEKSNAMSCWVMVSEARSGYFSDTDSAYFELMKTNALNSTKGGLVNETHGIFKGYPAFEFSIKGKFDKETILFTGRMVNKGGRRFYYYSVTLDDPESAEKGTLFLNSFDFLPIPEQTWSYQTSPLKDISFWSPAPIQFQQGQDSASQLSGVMLYDSLAPVSILITKEAISSYSWWQNDSVFFRTQANRFLLYKEDSIKEYKLIANGELPGAEFSVKLFDNHNIKKVRLFTNGDTLYSVFGFATEDQFQQANYIKLFNEVQFANRSLSQNYLTNKTFRILKDLKEGDSATFVMASEGLRNAVFTVADLPLLQNALLYPYRDVDGYSFGYGINGDLINEIIKLDEGSSLGFVEKNYASLKDSTEKLKYPLLYLLLKLKTKKSYDLFRQLLTTNIPKKGNANVLLYAITDSLALAVEIFPDLLKMSDDTTFIKILPYVTAELLDSGRISLATVNPFKKNIYAFAERELARLRVEKPRYDYDVVRLIDLLSYFKEPSSFSLMNRFLSTSSLQIMKRAAILLSKNQQPVNPIYLEQIAADDYFRIDLYDELKEIKKEKLFPPKFLNQKRFAQSELFNAASDDEVAKAVIFIGEKLAVFNGKPERFFLFKVVYENEEGESESFLGITGPYPKTPGKIISRSKVAGLSSDPYDPKNISDQFKAYLKDWEGYLKKEGVNKE